MVAYATPGVYLEAFDRAPRGVGALRTDIAAFVGLAERGPLDEPTKVESWAQFEATFGGFLPHAFLAFAVKAFFENRGRTCYVTRVAAPEVVAAVPPAPAPDPDRLVVAVDGSVEAFVPGAAVTVRQDAPGAPGTGVDVQIVVVAAVDAGARTVRFAAPLAERFDLARPLGLATGAGAAGAVLADAAGRPALVVTASSPGTWGNGVAVRLARSSPAATSPAARVQPPDRRSLHVEGLAGFEPWALVRIAQETPAGVSVRHRFVAAIDPVRRMLVFDEPLDEAFDLDRTASLETCEFSVSVFERGRLREVAGRLGLHPDHERFAFGDGAGARHVAFARPAGWPDAAGADEVAARLPAPGPAVALAGGRDGLAGLRTDDILGHGGLGARHGLETLEVVDEVAIVALPDVHARPAPPVEYAPEPEPEPDPCCPRPVEPVAVPMPTERVVEQPPGFTSDEIARAQQRLVEHCEAARDRVAVLDAPRGLDAGEVAVWRRRFDTSWAALYYPWLAVLDPLQRGAGPVRLVPPSGHVCGVYARADAEVGVHRAPANLGLEWAQDAEVAVDAATQGGLNPIGVNCLRVATARGLQVYGARTLSSDSAWRFVNVRRLLAMIAESLLASVQWAVFEPHDDRLRRLLTLAATSFLRGLWQAGALVGDVPADAFFVRCDDTTNPAEVVDAGQLRCDIGVAPTVPAEFVVVRIGRVDNEWKELS